MPSMPPVLGGRPRIERQRAADAERTAAKPWRKWYWTARWRRKAKAQLENQPLCERHLARGETVAATIANHRVPHRGDPVLFWEGELESACKACHDSEIQREEREGAKR